MFAFICHQLNNKEVAFAAVVTALGMNFTNDIRQMERQAIPIKAKRPDLAVVTVLKSRVVSFLYCFRKAVK